MRQSDEWDSHLAHRREYSPFEYVLSRMYVEQLQEKIKKRPMTKRSLGNFLKHTRVTIQRIWLPYSGECYATGTDQFNVVIKDTCTLDEELITLAHELVHVYYKVLDPYPDRFRQPKENRKVEDLIESEAEKFIQDDENRSYLVGLLSQITR
ncbi:MAG: hypothetical protein AABY10_06305 [Nanoarchaeota archaeon]